MPKFEIDNNDPAKEINEVLIDVPAGKIDLAKPGEVKVQRAQKMSTCLYYTLNYLRPRYGKAFDAETHSGRKTEKIISSYRKTKTQIEKDKKYYNELITILTREFRVSTRPINKNIVKQTLVDRLINNLQVCKDNRKKILFAIENAKSEKEKAVLNQHLNLYQQKQQATDTELKLLQPFLDQDKFDCIEKYFENKILEATVNSLEKAFIDLNIDPKKEFREYLLTHREDLLQLNAKLPETLEKEIENLENLSLKQKVIFYANIMNNLMPIVYGLSYTQWQPKAGINVLIDELRQRGPLAVYGGIGDPFYTKKPHLLEEDNFGYRKVYGWNRSEYDNEWKGIHCVLLIGASKIKDKEYVYFLDPIDESDPQKPGRVYKMSYERLVKSISNTYGFVVPDKQKVVSLKGPFGFYAPQYYQRLATNPEVVTQKLHPQT